MPERKGPERYGSCRKKSLEKRYQEKVKHKTYIYIYIHIYVKCTNVFCMYIHIYIYILPLRVPSPTTLRSSKVEALRLTFGTLVIPKPCGSSLTFLKRLVTSLEGSTRSQYTKKESKKKNSEIASKPKVAKKKMLKDLRMFSSLSLLHPFVVPIDVLLFLLHLSQVFGSFGCHPLQLSPFQGLQQVLW